MVKGLQGIPQQPDPNRPGLAIPIKVNFDPPVVASPILVEPEGKHRQIRRMRFTQRILDKYGYSDNCEGCRYKQAGFGESRNHDEACRTRIETAMQQDEEGRQHKAAQDERLNRRIAERMETEMAEADEGKTDQKDKEELVRGSLLDSDIGRMGISNPGGNGSDEGGGLATGAFEGVNHTHGVPLKSQVVGGVLKSQVVGGELKIGWVTHPWQQTRGPEKRGLSRE